MPTDEQIEYARKQIAEQLPYFPPPKHLYDRGEETRPALKPEKKKEPKPAKKSFTIEP